MTQYPRDLVGDGDAPPDPRWPGGARIAVQFVVNVEEGGEHNILHGDQHSEYHLSETPAQPLMGMRNLIVESFYEYGSRAGFWRIMRLFADRGAPFTAFAVCMSIEAFSTMPIPTPTICPYWTYDHGSRILSCPTRRTRRT
jgi:allantoinase